MSNITPEEKAHELLKLFTTNCRECDNAGILARLCVREIIAACEYNQVEIWNTTWWKRVLVELDKF